MDQIVLDTNVIVKLFLEEEGSDTAVKIKDAHIEGKVEVMVPSLMKYELVNVLKYKNFEKEEIKEAIEAVRDYAFSVVDVNDFVVNKIVDFSVDYNISAYDATYVAFAYHIGALFYTADDKMLLKVKKLNFVRPLSHFSV
ncbi:MAG: type II toxin-antitoxin system VapC family toxin [Candidatus Marsarchaeota archaeon]|jgi:predicted nucleic acid-binding protein|nr:type II toxin-antitoxin system VapC family toxin [Candidatus Marsarchaeota archaeon]